MVLATKVDQEHCFLSSAPAPGMTDVPSGMGSGFGHKGGPETLLFVDCEHPARWKKIVIQ